MWWRVAAGKRKGRRRRKRSQNGEAVKIQLVHGMGFQLEWQPDLLLQLFPGYAILLNTRPWPAWLKRSLHSRNELINRASYELFPFNSLN